MRLLRPPTPSLKASNLRLERVTTKIPQPQQRPTLYQHIAVFGGKSASTHLPSHFGFNGDNISLKARILEIDGGMAGVIVFIGAGVARHLGLGDRGRREFVVIGRSLLGLLSVSQT